QIDIQERAIKFGLQAAGIQLKLAQVQEATMYPAAPFNGTVQRIHVKVGDSVNPGTTLVTFSGNTSEIVIDARVPKALSEQISRIEKASMDINGKKIEMMPSYISTEATSGQLYSILFTLPDEYKQYFTDKAFVTVSLPVGNNVSNSTPFIPVDSVFQTQDEAFVYVVNGNKARSKKIKLGTVTGGFVTVEQGLSPSDQVILNRTVIDGDLIQVQN
ncbi:MAG: HlyD family efflux transporter periplasmic adaptor subunit, partial [Candidatus Levybacteria bacterium]|nr:HlyD family efflux transporter periplasmic adaptor subunit [Candidatus Levybacteria bacterium]